MRKMIPFILFAALCLAGCSAADDGASGTFGNAAPEMIEENAFSVIEDFDAEVYGLTPEAPAAGQNEPAVAAADEAFPEPTSASSAQHSPLIYTIFEGSSGSFSAEDGTKLFINQNFSPRFNGTDTETATWLNSLISQLDDQTAQIRINLQDQAENDYKSSQDYAEGEGQPFYAYSYYSSMNTGRQDDVVISLLQVDSVYSGGVHPNYVQKAYNFDLTARKQLELSDVLYPDAISVLVDQILGKLEDRLTTLEGTGFFDDYKETVADYFSDSNLTPYWYFSENGLVVYFNCYDIAPYAAGIIKVELPYSVLDGILLPVYFPATRTEAGGSLVLLTSAENRAVLHIPHVADGEEILLSSDGTVYDVRLYQISSWITEETPIIGQMLFSTNRLTGAEALSVFQSGQTQMPEYLVTYCSGAGEQYRFAVSDHEIRSVKLSGS